MDLFPSSGKEKKTPTLFGPLERANLNHQKPSDTEEEWKFLKM
jgi:hypothetical protein